MEPWYKVASRAMRCAKGARSIPTSSRSRSNRWSAATAPEDYRNPAQFFARTCFTRALSEHAGMVLRRLSGETDQRRPGADAHHAVRRRQDAHADRALPPRDRTTTLCGGDRLADLLRDAGHCEAAEDAGRRLRRQRLGPAAPDARRRGSISRASSPAMRASRRWAPQREDYAARHRSDRACVRSGRRPVLMLFDEVLNFLNRHRDLAESFHAFMQNLTVAMTGTRGQRLCYQPAAQPGRDDASRTCSGRSGSPRSSGASRRICSSTTRRRSAKSCAGDCSKIWVKIRPARAVATELCRLVLRASGGTAAGVDRGRQRGDRGESAGLSARPVRGLLSVSSGDAHGVPAEVALAERSFSRRAARSRCSRSGSRSPSQEGSRRRAREPLITLGSAPLDEREFRSVVLGQLGEMRLEPAIDSDIAGEQARRRSTRTPKDR